MKRKRIIRTMLIAASVCALTACSGDRKTAASASPEETGSAAESEITLETEAESSAEPDSSAETESALADTETKQPQAEGIFPTIRTEYQSISADDGTLLVSAQYPQIEVGDSGSGELAAVLNSWNAEVKSRIEQTVSEDEEWARDSLEYDGPLPYTEDADAMIMRADADVLSIRTGYYCYTGGSHGSYSISCHNYNLATGGEMSLDDVISDRDALYEQIMQTLDETYEKDMFFEGYDKTVKDEVFENEEDGYRMSLTWSLEADGITVYFEQYEIAPYAAGYLMVKLPYDGNEAMFTDSGMFANKSRVIPITTYQTIYVNVDGTSRGLRIEDVMEGNSDYRTMYVHLGDSEVSAEAEYGVSAAYLMQKDNGKNFLYMEVKSDNDYRVLHVFDLNQEEPVYKGYYENGSFYEQVPVNADSFRLSSRINLLSTYTGEKIYRVGADGMPEALDDTYAVDGLELTAKREVPAFTGESMDEESVIPAGTAVTITATDGETWVDLKDTEGTVYRVYVNTGWPQNIDGIDIEDCFDGIRFAG